MVALSPAIRILCLLVFAAGIAHARGWSLTFGLTGLGLVILASWPLRGQLSLPGAGTALRRLRWLLLALIGIYGWLTPGVPVIAGLAEFAPSWEGLQAGAIRALILLSMVLAVYLLLTTTSRDQLLTGLSWLTRPLRWLGLDAQRLNVRIVLTLQLVPRLQLLIREWQAQLPSLRQWRDFGAALPRLWQGVLEEAETDPLIELPLPVQPRPLWWEWLAPLLIMLAFAAPVAFDAG